MPGTRRRFDAEVRRERAVARLVGVDEAGRGPWAGPVVVAAVLLGPEVPRALWAARDSKRLSPRRREELFLSIRAHAAVSAAWAHPREIERMNILGATLAAMRRAVLRLGAGGAHVLVDGNRRIPRLPLPQTAVVGGDDKSLAVACASIVAKVLRDRWMRALARRHPGYGFAQHKGYGTAGHRAALARLGVCPIHRRTYAPVAALL